MKSKKLFLSLLPIVTVTSLPLVSASCDWLYDKPRTPKKPSLSDPTLPKRPEVNPSDKFDNKLLYEIPKPRALKNDLDGPHKLFHYIMNIHKLKVLDASGNETSEFESTDKKIERYNEALKVLEEYEDHVRKVRNIYDEKWEEAKKLAKTGKNLTYGKAFYNHWYANYQFFTESRLKDNDPELKSLTENEIKQIHKENFDVLPLWITIENFMNVFEEIFNMRRIIIELINLYKFMMRNVNNENKTLLEQLQAMGPDKLKQLKDMIQTRIIKAELVNLKVALEINGKLYSFSTPDLKFNYDKPSHYNKIINWVNEFINPLSYLLGFNTNNYDYFYDNPTKEFKWIKNYFFGRKEYGSSAKGFTIGRLTKYNTESALKALEQWLNKYKNSFGIKYNSLK